MVSRVSRGVDLLRHRRAFARLERYVTFIGHPRNASTLVGALLDAHPDAVVCHELRALNTVDDMSRDHFLYAHVVRSRWFNDQMDRRWEGYDYRVDDDWQGGRHRRLKVIGDKMAGTATVHLGEDPELLGRLASLVQVPLAFVHVVRHPLDNIATIVRRAEKRRVVGEEVDRFFRRCDTIARIRAERPEQVIEVHQEDLMGDARSVLRRMAMALELEPEQRWLDAAARLVSPSVPSTAGSIDWPDGAMADVRRRMSAYEWFERYT